MKLHIPAGSFRAYLFDCDGTIADSMPVSYTHLDVYKRQTLRLTAECSAIELLRSALKGILHYNVSRERDARQKF